MKSGVVCPNGFAGHFKSAFETLLKSFVDVWKPVHNASMSVKDADEEKRSLRFRLLQLLFYQIHR